MIILVSLPTGKRYLTAAATLAEQYPGADLRIDFRDCLLEPSITVAERGHRLYRLESSIQTLLERL